MKVQFLLFLLIVLINADKLLGVVEYFRHGQRGPISQDKFNPHNWLDSQLGQLTGTGLRTHFLIGHEMRRRYVKTSMHDDDPQHILPFSFHNSTIEVRSDNYERCILSAQAQLIGLYPPSHGPKLINIEQQKASPPFNVSDKTQIQQKMSNRALPHQLDPVPIFIHQNDTMILQQPTTCERALQITEEFTKSLEFQQWVQEFYIDSGFQEEISRVFLDSGLMEFQELISIYDWSVANKAQGYELPEGFTIEIEKQLSNLATYYFFTIFMPNEESIKLQSSGFLQDTIVFFEKIIKGTTDIKMKLWSGHDTSLMPVVKALQLEPSELVYQSPTFAANLFIELYENQNKEYYVLLKYQDYERKSNLCNGETCTFEKFKQEINDFISYDVIGECTVKHDQVQGQRFAIAGIGVFGFLLI